MKTAELLISSKHKYRKQQEQVTVCFDKRSGRGGGDIQGHRRDFLKVSDQEGLEREDEVWVEAEEVIRPR